MPENPDSNNTDQELETKRKALLSKYKSTLDFSNNRPRGGRGGGGGGMVSPGDLLRHLLQQDNGNRRVMVLGPNGGRDNEG